MDTTLRGAATSSPAFTERGGLVTQAVCLYVFFSTKNDIMGHMGSLRGVLLLFVLSLCHALFPGGEMEMMQKLQSEALRKVRESVREMSANAERITRVAAAEAAARMRAPITHKPGDEL